MRTRVKFCGMTSLNDAKLAVDAGADAVGMIFADSPRRITLDIAEEIIAALPPFVTPVGVFVDPAEEELQRMRAAFPRLRIQVARERRSGGHADIEVLHIAQHSEPSQNIDVRAMVEDCGDALVLFDTKIAGLAGGTGESFGWEIVVPIARERRIGIAGGLTPENVTTCIQTVRPYFVDVRSGVETGGKKDMKKMHEFIAAVRSADAASPE